MLLETVELVLLIPLRGHLGMRLPSTRLVLPEVEGVAQVTLLVQMVEAVEVLEMQRKELGILRQLLLPKEMMVEMVIPQGITQGVEVVVLVQSVETHQSIKVEMEEQGLHPQLAEVL